MCNRTISILTVLALSVFANMSIAAESNQPRPFKVGYRIIDFDYPKAGRLEKLTVAVWYPTSSETKKYEYGGPTEGQVAVNGALLEQHGSYPLLVFAHGYGGSGLSAVFFTELLAAQGWVVVAPDHHDRHSIGRIRTGRNKDFNRRAFFRHAKEIAASSPTDRDKYLYRLDEMQLALKGILSHDPFGKIIDKGRIAVGGHSLGGYTALGLCGTISDRLDPRIKAVLLFSTGSAGYLYSESELQRVRVPSMLFMGARERNQQRGLRSMLELSEKVFGSLGAPKYFLEVKKAGHFSFNNQLFSSVGAWLLSGNEEMFRVIRHYSIAFLEKHVAGRLALDDALLRNDPMLATYSKVLVSVD